MPTGPKRPFVSLLAVALLAGCPRKPEEQPVVEQPVEVQPVEVELQVASISPSTVDANAGFSAKVYGRAFQSGAKVDFSGTAATSVSLVDENTLTVAGPALAAGSYDIKVTNPDGESSSLRGGLTVKNMVKECAHLTVGFDFDSSSLTSGAKSTLSSNSSCLSSASSVRVEGHADERGTTEYNLALGQRRADSVQRYLTQQGVAPSKVDTVSYGEERPANRGHDEAAWAENRRAEINAK